jgi:KAP-like P-loop domain-containing protein
MATSPDLEALIRQTIEADKKEIPNKRENFADRADQAGLGLDKLIKLTLEKADEITTGAAALQLKVNELQRDYNARLNAEVERSLQREARLLKVFPWAFYAVAPFAVAVLLIKFFKIEQWFDGVTTGSLTIGLLIILGAFFGIYMARKEQPENNLRGLDLLFWIFATVVPFAGAAFLVKVFLSLTGDSWMIRNRPPWQLIGGIIIVFAALYGPYNYRKEQYVKNQSGKRKALEQEKEFTNLKESITDAEKKRDDAIIAQGIKPQLKEVIAGHLKLEFTTLLPKLNFPGLSEVFNSANEIATEAQRELEFMLNTMPGGSIGIAGPRGSGKSTLLKSACADLPNNLKDRGVITLLTTSPVEYQGRDFILHLFSSMCRKVLHVTTKKKKTTQSGWVDVSELRLPKPPSIVESLQQFAPFAFYLGAGLIGLSILLGLVLMNAPAPAENDPSKTTATQQSTPQVSPTPAASPTPTPPAVVRFMHTLELKPGVFFISGFVLLLFFAVLRFYKEITNRSNRKDAADSEALIQELGLKPEVAGRLFHASEDARKWIADIKFQQSYTSGWSGNIQLPIGLAGGANTAVSLAERQLSLPDITTGFSSFLTGLTGLDENFKVIIGIDELDKLESDEAAQRFLNEIKAIFGIENVFYLISVSENAMSNFERRGVPFRDVFDSSFDNIIYVPYLKLEQAKRLIARRVIGMPPPFVHLCYCISGGLARDLVRACRNLMQHSSKAYERGEDMDSNLENLSKILISSDLSLKLQALTVVAKRLTPTDQLGAFLDKVHSLQGKLESSSDLLAAYVDLLKASKSIAPKENGSSGVNGLVEVYGKLKQRLSGDAPNTVDRKTIASLHEELASYVYYCVTVLEFFSDVLDQKKLERGEQDKIFDRLAQARQYLAINPSITRSMLDKFREEFRLTVPVIHTSVVTV